MKIIIPIMIVVGLIVIGTYGTCLAAPSESMLQAMKAPVSVFDFVLFQIAYELKFINVDGRHSYLDELIYGHEDDRIQISFIMPDSHARWFVFKNSDERRKERILRAEIEILNTFIVRLIKNMSIYKFLQTEEFDAADFKLDLVKRLNLTLNTFDANKIISYEVTRNQSGEITYRREALLDKEKWQSKSQ